VNPPESIDKTTNSGKYDPRESDSSIPPAPSAQQSAFEQAAQAIVRGVGTRPSDPASFGSEVRNLEEWARVQKILIEEDRFDPLSVISNHTSEHEVFLDIGERRAIKRTWPGVYGQIPSANAGKLDRRNATPTEYLSRMALHIAVFGSDIRFEGVTISGKPSMIIGQPAGQPSLVVSQQWYEKEGVATAETIHDFMVAQGFRPVPASYYGWFRPTDGIVIVDAKPDNFIQTSGGLIAIDLQIAQFNAAELSACGLTSAASDPVLFIPR
jgi:Serine/Threonine/Tyrosine Kinase found in polyvalent proteins